MSRQPYPEWMKTAFDERFNEMARVAGKEQEVEPLQRKQIELEKRLKGVLTFEQFQLILEFEDVHNYRNALEKESMYLAGIKDGMKMINQFQAFLSS